MLRNFLRWLLPLIIAVALWLNAAHAQSTASSSEAEPAHNPAFPYTIAFLTTILIMVIICSPSRKR